MTSYECRFAPSARTWRDAIRVGQLVHDHGTTAAEAFAPDAFAGWGASPIPVLIDHDEQKHAGTVTVVSAHKDWALADFVLDGPHAAEAAALIERSGKVSPSIIPLDKDPYLATPHSPFHNPTHWYTRAKLFEISVLSPTAAPWYEGAQVTHTHRAPSVTRSSAAVATSDRPAVGETFYGNGQTIHRFFENAVLTVGGRPVG